jgi:protein-tyrosine-phosphatase
MVKILFVCSGNVFRSMSAEKLLKKYLSDNNISDIFVDSAGICGDKNQKISLSVLEQLKKFGVDAKEHKHKKCLKKNIKWADLVVSMGHDHRKYLKENFNIDSVLFNKICYGVNYPVYDNWQVLKNPKGFERSIYDAHVVKKIKEDMFYFYKNFKKFI